MQFTPGMQRCRHKKSRKGCLECKRRHIRCDEGKPICINCITAERSCEYRERKSPNLNDATLSSSELNATLMQDADNSSATSSLRIKKAQTTDVNMSHLELLAHFSFAIYAPELEEDDLSTKLVLEAALKEEYLMLEVLAISARHLSTTDTDEADCYSRKAVELQTKAIELFNNADTVAADDNPIARLLFSSVLGRHMLVDVLARRDADLETFIDRFTQGARVHRGVRAVTTAQEWEILLTSKVGPLITKGLDPLGYHDTPPLRPHFTSLLSRTARLDDHDKEACTKALCMIEGALDDLQYPDRSSFALRMIFVWPILLPERFIVLLERGIPEAIAIMGRYSILLHAGESLWQVMDVGPYLLMLVSSFLGSDWDEWL
ncbi:uncharacterized protein FMAN_06855 [Fusarium mangiferae]|uniref:Zn(2)-C6 fungal-type domain-containing protein n=1 Tax=Fusarium mangiferae TaxID=192010 RepID=A0A1L7ULP2_FUSMA|nr:uncharacterized protein FMAN_06855 [Fusarium mangiferae]CVL08707.1 uncharacterized protein FMAN_06855 [Fusarium mangiferae]